MARELCEGEEKSNEMVVGGGGGSGGFYYNSNNNNNIQSQFTNQMETGFGSSTVPAEIMFNESTGGGADEFDQNMMVVGPWGAAAAAQENNNNNNRLFHLVGDDSSLRCVFPCEPNERPSQGLSLSLSSSNPSSIGLQSFELRPQQQQSSLAIFQLRNSRFLSPAQDLLYEFCSLGITNNNKQQQQQQQQPLHCSSSSSPKHKSSKHWDHLQQDASNSSSTKFNSLHSLDFIELQKRKTKLFSMLEEVERRYRHYCEQMKGVVASFEAVAGSGAARVYSALASKAMSRHFRSLKDGIVGQIEATKKAMGGEKDPIAPGTTRGETPRLRVIDQALRQQRAFHQISIMETHPWRPQRGLPERSVSVLRAWLFEHFLHPYPSDVDKHILARQTGLSRSQVSNWFINARVRLWKPMVEEMYLEETKEREEEMNNNNNFNNNNHANSDLDGMADFDDEIDCHRSILTTRLEDQKPTPDQLLRIDSECLSSIISNNSEKNDSRTMKAMQSQQHHHHHLHNTFGRVAPDAFGTVELDFSYNHHANSGGVSYPNNNSSNNNNQHFNSGGVSLTLGLQQHAAAGGNNGGGGGVSIAFSPVAAAAAQSSLFFTRDQMEECQPVQYSLLDGETQNLPYRNLMGAQLLHDLAG